MDSQTLINILYAALGGVLGFLLKIVWERLDKLSAADAELTEKVQAIEVLVVGKYVTWEGFQMAIKPLGEQLNRIEEKLDRKADK